MILDQELKAFGYYKFNNQTYLNKQDMFKAFRSRSDLDTAEFVFNDEVYSCYDWTQEPDPHLTLKDYYRQRAQQIRDTHDYVVLLLSGGPDSMNVLESFVQNGIRLDEIVNVNSYDQTQDLFGNHNSDFVYNIKPRLDAIFASTNTVPPKITIIDEIEMTKIVWEDYRRQGGHHELFQGSHYFAAHSWLFKGLFVKHLPHLWQRIQADQKVVVVKGTEKTHVKVDNNGRYYTQMFDPQGPDIALALTHDRDFQKYKIIEWFYHSPNMPQMWIKQAHVLKKFVDQQPAHNFESLTKYQKAEENPPYICFSKYHPGNLKYDLYHKTIYPNWAPNIVTPKSMWTGTRTADTWWAAKLPAEINRAWRHGLYYMKKNFKDYVMTNNSGREIRGLPVMFTRKYYLD